jgi:uncharacterized Tic20 family protein
MTQQPPYNPPLAPPMSDADQRLWATLIHVGGIFFGILPSLIGYLVVRGRGAFIEDHAKNALNFHITYLIAAAVAGLLTIVIIGVVLLPIIIILAIIFSIMAAVAANNSQLYVYPLSIKFIK